jgi:hypothetical protein
LEALVRDSDEAEAQGEAAAVGHDAPGERRLPGASWSSVSHCDSGGGGRRRQQEDNGIPDISVNMAKLSTFLFYYILSFLMKPSIFHCNIFVNQKILASAHPDINN